MKEVFLEESRGSRFEGSEKMVVTIFYPDAKYGAEVVQAFQRAVLDLGEKEALDPRPWRLDVLQWPEMQAEAARDIASSRLVVVPADEVYASSEFFRRWVEGWPPAQEGQQLLLVPRRGAADTPPSVRQFGQWLQETCTRKGMDFAQVEMADLATSSMQHQGTMTNRRLNPPLVPPLAPPLAFFQQPEAVAVYAPEWERPTAPRFWGLNE